MPDSAQVLIVGGGLAGLSCAKRLWGENISFTILEASDAIGGRVRTDHVDGFLLDRGFQVFLTAYLEAKRQLDYQALKLHSFFPGALIRSENRFYEVADPFRFPIKSLKSLSSPIGTIKDKLRVIGLARKVRNADLDNPPIISETSTHRALQQLGFSETMIERFFRPFFGGVFLNSTLSTSSRVFEFLFRMFSQGPIALPASGMRAIPDQLASFIPEGSIQTNAPVVSVKDNHVLLRSGQCLESQAVVVATNGSQAAKLINGSQSPTYQQATCLYFVAQKTPVKGPYLVLNGEAQGLINHLCVLSEVAPSYAPPGQSLISVTVLNQPTPDSEETEKSVRAHLVEWFGSAVQDWRLLRIYHIAHALPLQIAALHRSKPQHSAGSDNVFLCGDYRESATHHGALLSGRHTAEDVIATLKR